MDTSFSQVQRPSKPKSPTELIKEIAMLELEVVNLEKHLLCLYRKVFDQRLAKTSSNDSNGINQMQVLQKGDQQSSCRISLSPDEFRVPRDCAIVDTSFGECIELQRELNASIHRCHSSLSLRSAFTIQSPVGKVADAEYSYHSMPLIERASGEVSDSVTSLGDYLSNHGFDQVTETANSISEEIVRCISSMYRELSTNSMNRNDFASPAVSFTTSMSGSPHAESNLWSPPYRIHSLADSHSDAHFNKQGYEVFSGPYSQMVEVLQISRESNKLKEIEPLFQKYRSLVSKLERINPSKLKHEEKLAFWINVHNALVMHAFLVFSTPNIKLKRGSFLLKVAYKVGGHTVSVGMIQKYILGRQLPHPGQWLKSLFHPRKKFRTGDARQMFSLDHPEPLSYFALCCGCHSDPPVRVYKPKTVFHDLITARGDYISSNYKFDKEQNMIMLPKIVDTYAKLSGLHPADFMSIIEQILPIDSLRSATCKYRDQKRKGLKTIGWITPNFSFRYQFPKELFQ